MMNIPFLIHLKSDAKINKDLFELEPYAPLSKRILHFYLIQADRNSPENYDLIILCVFGMKLRTFKYYDSALFEHTESIFTQHRDKYFFYQIHSFLPFHLHVKTFFANFDYKPYAKGWDKKPKKGVIVASPLISK